VDIRRAKLAVKDPAQLNKKIRKMVEDDLGGIWKKANGKYNQSLKNPTWGVYELFRKIGAKPRFRGPMDSDPGKSDMFYYKEWEFKDDGVVSSLYIALQPKCKQIQLCIFVSKS
jgi:hypothetical protein